MKLLARLRQALFGKPKATQMLSYYEKQHELAAQYPKEAELITWVASAEDSAVRETYANEVASQLTLEQFRNLPLFFHTNPPTPDELKEKFKRLGAWMVACQHAIFEIFYHQPDVTLPIIREVAFGVYDWTQVTALYTLCRLAKDGIDTQQIIDDIAEALPHFAYEAQMPTIEFLGNFQIATPKLIQNLKRLYEEHRKYDPIDAFTVLTSLFYVSSEDAKKEESFLRDLMHGKGLENRSALLDGAIMNGEDEVVSWGSGGPPPANIHQVRAASLLYHMFPNDVEVNRMIQIWSENHPDENIRSELQALLTSNLKP